MKSIEELAIEQGVEPCDDPTKLFGTWPGEVDDGFEDFVDEIRHGETKPFEKWTSRCGRVTLYRGDCLDVMPTLDADSIDSVITDPPYGLTSGSGKGGFMGKLWDAGAFRVFRSGKRRSV